MLYVGVNDGIYAAPVDGSAPATLVAQLPGGRRVRGFALDPAHDRIFAIDVDGFNLYVASLGTVSTPTAIVSGGTLLVNPAGLSIDTSRGVVYWGTEGTGTNGVLAQAPVTGGGTEIATPGYPTKLVMGVAYAPGSDTLYWAQYATPTSAIRWAKPDGSAAGTIDTTGATMQNPISVAVSRTRGRIYWGNFSMVSSAALTGGDGTNLASALLPRGIAIDDAGGRLYWADDAVSIHTANLDGGAPTDITPAGLPAGGTPWGLSLLLPPVATGAPVISGSASPGHTLSCAAGTWAGDAPESFAFRAAGTTSLQWFRGGVAIDGATQPDYLAGVAGSYTCRSQAANAAGSTSSISDAIVLAPTTEVAMSMVRLTAHWTVRGRVVSTTFQPPSTAMTFTITATRSKAIARSVRGRCRVKQSHSTRSVTCNLRLARGRWAVTTTALKGTTTVARSTRVVTIRPAAYAVPASRG